MAKVYTGVSDRWYDDYDRGRPGWPPGVVRAAGLLPSAAVVELGAGTGKLTRLLATEFARVIAVEPDEGMRRLLAVRCPEAGLHAGSAEAIPLADASVDGVFAAESFHLYDWPAALAEIARVLRPPGALVLAWNLPAGPTVPPVEAVERLLLAELGPTTDELGYDPVDLNSRRYSSGEWRLAFAASLFEEPQEIRLANPQMLDRDGIVAFLASMGWIADLADDRRLPLLAEVRSLLTAAEYWRPWETHVHVTWLR